MSIKFDARLWETAGERNTVGTLLLIGPVDRGGAAVEIELIDAETGKQLAALTQGYFSPMSELKAQCSTWCCASSCAL